MKVCICFLLFRLFAYTNSLSRVRQKGHHRGVHVPQRTVPEYNNYEYSGDTNHLDDVQNIETRGTTHSNRNVKLVFRAPSVETLTDFIQEAVKILNTYEDTAFKDFFHVLDSEIRKYHYRGCKFSELTQNSDTRRLLAGSLKLIRGKPVSFTKANINEVADMLRDETYDKNVKELLSYINSLYTNTELNFYSVLSELKYYRNSKSVRTHNYLVQVIRGAVRAVLFNPFSELDIHTRREVKERIETFWKQFKHNPASSAEMNDIPYTNPVIKSVVKSIKALKNPEHSKNDPQIKLKNISKRIVSKETDNEQFHDDKTEVNESGNEFWKPDTDYAADEIASRQSFDSNPNSTKNSQERHEEPNTQRYMTLYTEEISYKAKTTKKIEIVPLSASAMTRRLVKTTTTSTPRERDVSSDETKTIEMLRANHDADDTKQDISDSRHDTERGLTLESKHKPRANEKYDKQRKYDKSNKSRSKSKHKNAQIIRQYDAVIDVQLANTELLKSLGMFDPFGMDTKYDITLYSKSATQSEILPIKPKIRTGSVRANAQIKPQKPITLAKPPTRYLKSYKSFFRKQFEGNEGHSVKQYKKDQKFITKRSNNDTIGVKDFNKYVIQRIDAIEKELNELKEINDNNTDGVEVSTDKYEPVNYGSERKDMKGKVIERFQNENRHINNETVNDGHTIRNNTMNTESTTNNITTSERNVIKKDEVNATIIDNKNITQVTNNNVNFTNNTKEINTEVINNNALSTVTNTMKLESVVNTPTAPMTRSTMAYSEPSYHDWPIPPEGKGKEYLDPFELKNYDGLFNGR